MFTPILLYLQLRLLQRLQYQSLSIRGLRVFMCIIWPRAELNLKKKGNTQHVHTLK